MNRILFITSILVVLSGCQSTQQPMPENVLSNLSTQWVVVEACYNSDVYTVEQAANYREAINYTFSTWSISQDKINKAVSEQRVAIDTYQANNDGLGSTCKNWLLTFEESIRNVSKHQKQIALNQQRVHEINKAEASKPASYSTTSNSNDNLIQCTKFGDLSFNKNIQTFKGAVCPIGWLPYNGW